MNIRLTPDQEKQIEDELRSGHFPSAEEVIGEALRALREVKQASGTVTANGQRQAVREMQDFVEKNRVRLDGISVKELIREGRRQ